jgi:hypothetical protein
MSTIRAAFDQGQLPTVACFNRATVPLGHELATLVTAMQDFVDAHVAPVWGTPARLVPTDDFQTRAWALVFLDDADQANALAYHELTPDGLPVAKVFVRTINQAGDSVSVSASHELVEMLVDPAINLMSTGPDARTMYAYETADPVEALSFEVDGIPMTDFVYPAYFEAFRAPSSVPFDHLRKVKRPFQILAGGYQIIFRNGKWSDVTGSRGKARAFRSERREWHRSAIRKCIAAGGRLERSLRPRSPTMRRLLARIRR